MRAPKIRSFQRLQNGEAIIGEANDMMSREQIMLAPDAKGYKPNTILALITSGANAGQWGKYDPAGTTGLNEAKGYLYESREASTTPTRAVALVRDCDLNGKKLFWDTAAQITNEQIASAIAQLLSVDTATNYGGIRVGF